MQIKLCDMQTMVPLTIDIAQVPLEARQVLLAEAARRGDTFEVLVREALAEKAERVETLKQHQAAA